eukprot:c7153_g1_i1.p1 GENE.c7153_g1_i1~~c7153_g1_i1.p1  ORF type:complete len:156 (-),score=45.82 c7153_g1_i1:3-413(-)
MKLTQQKQQQVIQQHDEQTAADVVVDEQSSMRMDAKTTNPTFNEVDGAEGYGRVQQGTARAKAAAMGVANAIGISGVSTSTSTSTTTASEQHSKWWPLAAALWVTLGLATFAVVIFGIYVSFNAGSATKQQQRSFV